MGFLCTSGLTPMITMLSICVCGLFPPQWPPRACFIVPVTIPAKSDDNSHQLLLAMDSTAAGMGEPAKVCKLDSAD